MHWRSALIIHSDNVRQTEIKTDISSHLSIFQSNQLSIYLSMEILIVRHTQSEINREIDRQTDRHIYIYIDIYIYI